MSARQSSSGQRSQKPPHNVSNPSWSSGPGLDAIAPPGGSIHIHLQDENTDPPATERSETSTRGSGPSSRSIAAAQSSVNPSLHINLRDDDTNISATQRSETSKRRSEPSSKISVAGQGSQNQSHRASASSSREVDAVGGPRVHLHGTLDQIKDYLDKQENRGNAGRSSTTADQSDPSKRQDRTQADGSRNQHQSEQGPRLQGNRSENTQQVPTWEPGDPRQRQRPQGMFGLPGSGPGGYESILAAPGANRTVIDKGIYLRRKEDRTGRRCRARGSCPVKGEKCPGCDSCVTFADEDPWY